MSRGSFISYKSNRADMLDYESVPYLTDEQLAQATKKVIKHFRTGEKEYTIPPKDILTILEALGLYPREEESDDESRGQVTNTDIRRNRTGKHRSRQTQDKT